MIGRNLRAAFPRRLHSVPDITDMAPTEEYFTESVLGSCGSTTLKFISSMRKQISQITKAPRDYQSPTAGEGQSALVQATISDNNKPVRAKQIIKFESRAIDYD